jgi:lysyl-tRNA synthetase, class II
MTEFLTANTALTLKHQDVVRLSMNFAAWGRLWQDDDLTVSLRLLRWFVSRMQGYFQIKSLYDFNEKFDPDWLPRSIVCTSPAALPRIGVLFAGVEGFVDFPVVGKYFVPKVVHASDDPTAVPAST